MALVIPFLFQKQILNWVNMSATDGNIKSGDIVIVMSGAHSGGIGRAIEFHSMPVTFKNESNLPKVVDFWEIYFFSARTIGTTKEGYQIKIHKFGLRKEQIKKICSGNVDTESTEMTPIEESFSRIPKK